MRVVVELKYVLILHFWHGDDAEVGSMVRLVYSLDSLRSHVIARVRAGAKN